MLKVIMQASEMEGISDAVRELYTVQGDGTYKLTGIQGVKMQSDIDSMKRAKDNEVNAHNTTKEELRKWKALQGGDEGRTIESYSARS